MNYEPTLKNIIAHYKLCNKPILDSFMSYYKTINLEKIIALVTIEQGVGPFLLGNSHYRRIANKEVCFKIKKEKLLEIIEEIKKCKTFDEIFSLVEKQKVKNILCLIDYDISLALGAKLGLEPEKVYLHSKKNSVYESANILNNNIKSLAIKKEEIDVIFLNEDLQSFHIENLLCIYNKQIKKINQ